ncbi:patatin-like phospholipase family protein [Halomonas sp. KAO]|uniref:patatin-like phospholipase family protein n=1 Tax=unclassified Halomonas TaxID=2609666 RepID=UPI00189F5861|nr:MULTISPECIES: patatin-like phospholipase family protein [unclassified Halomonas]MBF7052158.1 patatin-like phospholipase family protein [Halomonas sp. KAO]MDT0501854.1 patatin-like phospholipase family protein [Halomonas sp. PAR7]MDT0513525.1 patatin-like phospholipase family protein [Halomonas sp. LES1]MDT0592553.1 patatin-like phospholipase family protein [Halomonas sp. PAR8]
MNDRSAASGETKRVALVLGSGGARGYAHIGVIEEVERRGYEVVAVSGCSMGALVGGVYAAGQLAAYRDWVCRLDYFDVLRLVDVSWSAMGAMKANKVMSKLESLVGDTRIEDLAIPVTTVATDLTHQREVWFQSGPLLEAIRASIAVPGVITPVHRGQQVLVDGGLLNPLPITPSVSAAADLVLAVNVTAHSPRPVTLEELLPPEAARLEREAAETASGKEFGAWIEEVKRAAGRWIDGRRGGANGAEGEEDEQSDQSEESSRRRQWGRLDMALASFDITQAALAKYKVAGYPPDVLIEVPKTVCGAYEFHRAEALITLGRQLAVEALDRYEGRSHPSWGGRGIIVGPRLPGDTRSSE